MNEFVTDDFRALNAFELSWRWTNPKWNVLPEAVLAQIHPLTEAKASELWPFAQTLGNDLYHILLRQRRKGSSTHFIVESTQEIDATQEHEVVQAQLALLLPQEEQKVVVMWDRTVAVTLSWSVFSEYWDDFCYPASDDVFIWPQSQDWFLLYYHEERFLFGQCV